jgi:proteasome lid subunit RPN8/RPN11
MKQAKAPHLVLTPEVAAATRTETLAWPTVETGGLWLGRYGVRGGYFVTDWIGPGPGAQHYLCSFRPDEAYQNAELQRKQEADSALELVAMWHRHPGGLDEPSDTDVAAARSVIKTWHLPRPEVVVGIAVAPAGEFRLRTFHMGAEDSSFREVPWDIAPPVCSPAPLHSWFDLEDGASYLKALFETADRCGYSVRGERENGCAEVSFVARERKIDIPLKFPAGFPFEPAWIQLPGGKTRLPGDRSSAVRALRNALIKNQRRRRKRKPGGPSHRVSKKVVSRE